MNGMNINIKDYISKKIHFIGIGGISMSGLASILLNKGYKVSGSDRQKSKITESLKEQGAEIFYNHDKSNVQHADLIVYTAAVSDTNPELIEAKKQGIPTIDRAAFLGRIMKNYKYSVGVAGTHGKTTTTSMLAIILQKANLDPTILVGGNLDAIGGNVRVGNSNYFLTEACEYVESFLKFYPYIAVITNIDKDHLDYYKDLDQIYHSFSRYADLVPKNGFLIGCADDSLVLDIMSKANCHTISFGIENNADLKASNIEYDENGCPSFRVTYNSQDMGWFSLKVQGRHNIYNALAAIATAWALGVSSEIIKSSIADYAGTHRRFEIKGTTSKGATIIDDYAHHPTEVTACLTAADNFPHNKLWCVFQPHTYTRTKALFDEFVDAFHGVDNLILTDIYAAREKDTGQIHSRDLANAISSKGVNCKYIPTFEEIVKHLTAFTDKGDIIITMGAGNVYEIGDQLLNV